MDQSHPEDSDQKQTTSGDIGVDASSSAPSSSPAIMKTLIACLVIALAVAWISSTTADRFRGSENVEHGAKYRGTHLSIETATRNVVVAYGILGAFLSLGLGATAGLLVGKPSIPRAVTAGIIGIVVGATLPAISSYILTPIYFNRLETADFTLTILIHLGIWTLVGLASGFSFGIGSEGRKGLLEAVIGGMIGAALGALIFDAGGVFFPFAHTERPLSEESVTRLVGTVVQSVFIVLGILTVVSQTPPASAKHA